MKFKFKAGELVAYAFDFSDFGVVIDKGKVFLGVRRDTPIEEARYNVYWQRESRVIRTAESSILSIEETKKKKTQDGRGLQNS